MGTIRYVLTSGLCLLLLSCCNTKTVEHKDYTLWYDAPAVEWEEALPVGNGRLGAMSYGNPFHECIQVNEESLWSEFLNIL